MQARWDELDPLERRADLEAREVEPDDGPLGDAEQQEHAGLPGQVDQLLLAEALQRLRRLRLGRHSGVTKRVFCIDPHDVRLTAVHLSAKPLHLPAAPPLQVHFIE